LARTIVDTLTTYKVVGIDTSPFIYHFQDEVSYSKITTDLFNAVEKGLISAVTSVVTIMEVLVKPMREADARAAEEYRLLLHTFPNLKLRIIDSDVASRAAGLRARYGIRAPDALQLGASIEEGANAFVTNDERLAKVKDIQVVILESFLPHR
jgi:predicted nucleic acid-binding protein